MWNNHSIPSTCDQGRGPGDRPDCILREGYISSKAATVTHRACGKTVDRTCISKLIQARGVNAKCPSCKRLLSRESTLEEQKRWTPELDAEWEAEFEAKLQAALTEAASADIAWVIERLRAERGEDWIANRPELTHDVQAAFEERHSNRLERVAEAVEDEEAEKQADRPLKNRDCKRQISFEYQNNADREYRRRKRDAWDVFDLREIYEAFAGSRL